MSASAEIQSALSALLAAEIPPGVAVIERRTKELGAEIAAAAGRRGLCAYVMPPLPTGAVADVPFVVFDRADVRVRVIEQPAVSAVSGTDGFALARTVMTALHWRRLDGVLAHPLQLAPRCSEFVQDARWRIIDVLFNGIYQVPRRAEVVDFAALGLGDVPDLQAAVAAQLAASGHLRLPVPVIQRRKKDLASDIAAAAVNHGLSIEVQPPRALRAMPGVPFVFIEAEEIRVRITEKPALNGSGIDAYDLIDDVAAALHWQTFGTLLPQPLQLAPSPVAEIEEDAGQRIFEVLFHATHQLNQET